MNAVALVGRVGKDAELKNVGDGTVLKFSLATSERWNDSAGQTQERTTWHEIEYWGKGAKALAPHITKGRELGVNGSIRVDEWEDSDGKKRSKAKIKAERLHLIGGKPKAKDERADDDSDEAPF